MERNANGFFYSKYSLYRMDVGLSFSYFLSNLQEIVIRRTTGYINDLPESLQSFLYSIGEDKEVYLIDEICLEDRGVE